MEIKKGKIFLMVLVCLMTFGGCKNGDSNQEKNNDQYKDIEVSEKDMPYIKKEHWWINETDTGVEVKDGNIKELQKKVKSYVNDDGHLYFELPDGTMIDAGYSDKFEPHNESRRKYSIVFKDYDGKELSSQKVGKDESVIIPEDPQREGYIFQGWDKDFDKIDSDMIINAVYVNENDSILNMENIRGSNNKYVDFNVSIKNNPGILGMTLRLEYDDDVLQLVDAKNGEALKKMNFTTSKILKNGCKFLWDAENISQEDIKDGRVLRLRFKIVKGAAKGNYKIGLGYSDGDIIDNNLEPLTLSIKDGFVIVDK